MKKLLQRAAALACGALLAATLLPQAAVAAAPLKFTTAGKVNGLYVSTVRGTDFPSAPNLSGSLQKQELDRIVDFAAQYGFNQIYYEAVANGGAFYDSKLYAPSEALSTKSTFFLFDWNHLDPLDYLVKQAAKQKIGVTAVIDPFLMSDTGVLPANKRHIGVKNSEYVLSAGGRLYLNPTAPFTQKLAVSAAAELASRYALDGILLNNFAYPSPDFELTTTDDEKAQLLTRLLSEIYDAVKTARSSTALGVTASGTFEAEGAFSGFADHGGWLSGRLLNFVVPSLETPADDGAYGRALSGWLAPAQKVGAKVYTANPANRLLTPAAESVYFGDRLELDYQLYENSQRGADGCVIKNYSAVKDNFFDVATGLAAAFNPVLPDDDAAYPALNLSIPQAFNITRPSEDIRTDYASYYLMGTSDPALPVTLDGGEVFQAPLGAFGAQVNLTLGENSFTLRQGENSKTVTITRYDPNAQPAATISAMRQSSIFPKWEEGVRADTEFTLSCVAPSGAAVSVQLEGRTVSLTQAAAAKTGVPAVFSAKTSLTGPYPADETTHLGKLSYAMSYNGNNSSYTSNGELSVVGKNANFAVEVTDMRGDTSATNVLSDFRDEMITSVEKGATDFVTGSEGDYYLLSCGGYIHKEDVKVLEGTAEISAALSLDKISYSFDNIGATLTIPATGKPYYISEYAGDTVIITFYNTSADVGKASRLTETGKPLSAVEWARDERANTTTVTLKTGGKSLWGYNVEFGDNTLILRAKNTPRLSQNPARPLEGVTIIMDAGHGGNDPGALGVAGVTGPVESQLNYMNAYAAYLRLTAMGATVHMTQTDDERLSYEQRMDIARDTRADFYLSFHLNSTSESTNSTSAKGIEIYYNEELAIPFGEAIIEGLTSATGRRNRGVLPATFRVTQMTHTPSLLCELGYMVSPAEYEQLCDPFYIYKAALGTADGILRAIRAANA